MEHHDQGNERHVQQDFHTMIIRSKAPLRLGLAGGGTDVSPFSEEYGGYVLNATINLYAYCDIIPRDDNKIIICLEDRNQRYECDSARSLQINGEADLVKGVYNRVVKDFDLPSLSFEIHTYVEATAGSGLGSSSTLVVAILGAFVQWFSLPLTDYDIALLAYSIEREDLCLAGGKQDQYAATFGGFNFMEFYANSKVIVNPLRIKDKIVNELSRNLVLFHTETSRESAHIIKQQQDNVRKHNEQSIDAMLHLKQQSLQMKEALLKNDLDSIGLILNSVWDYKRKMAEGITTDLFEKVYKVALEAGATGGKISGAGGGGYVFFYCPGMTRYRVVEALSRFKGKVRRFEFTNRGLETWQI